MSLIFCIVILPVIHRFSFFIFGTNCNALTIFCVFWNGMLILAITNPNAYYELSVVSLFLFLSVPLVVAFGVFVGSFFVNSRITNTLIPEFQSITNRLYHKASYLVLLVFASTIAYMLFSIKSELSLSTQEFRNIIYSYNSSEVHSLLGMLTPISWLFNGLLMYLVVRSIYMVLYSYETGCIKYLIINLVSYLLINSSMGGRNAALFIITILVSVIIINLPVSKKILMQTAYAKGKKYLATVGVVGAAVLLSITYLRDTESNLILAFYNTLVGYYTGPFFAFDQSVFGGMMEINDIDSRFGMSFLGLDTVLVSGLFRFLLGLDVVSLLSTASSAMHFGVNISDTQVTNAFYTILFTPYIDGGVIYVIVFIFGLGFVMPLIHYRHYEKIDFTSFSIILFLYQMIFQSTRTNILESPAFIIFFIIVVCVYFIDRKKMEFE